MLDLAIGFTGTSQGMNSSQLERLEVYLVGAFKWAKTCGLRPVLRHGDCKGADDEAARTAAWIGFYVIAYPCTIEAMRAYCPENRETMLPGPPLSRNKTIVDLSGYVVATPKEDREILRSGTWMTIRYARGKGKCLTILYP